jgi:hypothetical protein
LLGWVVFCWAVYECVVWLLWVFVLFTTVRKSAELLGWVVWLDKRKEAVGT